MRFLPVLRLALGSCFFLVAVGCGQQANAPVAVAATSSAGISSPSTPAASVQKSVKDVADNAKKPAFAPLGGDKKPKFALRNQTPGVIPGADRASEAKRLMDGWHNMAIRHAENLALAMTPEEKEEALRREPSARALRPFVTLIAHLVTTDPTDAPSLDALVFLGKFIKVPEIEKALAKAELDPMAVLLEHHSDDPKIVDAFHRLPRGDETDDFLRTLFDKTFNPKVRWSAGAQLIASLRRNDRPKEMEEIVTTMSEDRYLEGVRIGGKEGGSNARTWAIDKLREINTLAVGKTMPEVSGAKLEGGTGKITDYRGSIVVVDIWTTWCGPCVKMIPHVRDMTERLKDEPFAFLSVSCDRDQETLTDFLEENEMPWDHWWVGKEGEFVKTLNVSAYPTVYVLDAKGVIRHKGLRDEELEAAVDALLEEMKNN